MIHKKIRVLIVDDSAFMRKSLSIMLSSDPEIEVVGTGQNGEEGVELAKKLRPDVITLDIEMPKMDGLTALKIIMDTCPTSVLMVSSLTTEGADSTLKALELGAVDFLAKEMSFVSVNITAIKDDLLRKIKAIAKQSSIKTTLSRLQTILGRNTEPKAAHPAVSSGSVPAIGYKAIGLGISTGGPLSLQKVIPRIAAQRLKIPLFIVQHMPPKFTRSLAERLNELSEVTVKEAEDGEIVRDGVVYLAPGGLHMTVGLASAGQKRIIISPEPSNMLHKPSVDVMLNSLVKVYGRNLLGIIMTGMGRDGLEGIRALKAVNGYAIAQDESSCIVYGMPKAIVDAGFADNIVPLERIAQTINMVL